MGLCEARWAAEARAESDNDDDRCCAGCIGRGRDGGVLETSGVEFDVGVGFEAGMELGTVSETKMSQRRGVNFKREPT